METVGPWVGSALKLAMTLIYTHITQIDFDVCNDFTSFGDKGDNMIERYTVSYILDPHN